MASRPHTVLTGGTRGIGQETALGLARAGHRVTLLARDLDRARQTRARIQSECPAAQIDSVPCDLASLSTVRQAAATLAAAHSPVNVLINNAGLIRSEAVQTRDGYELQWQVNLLAPALLTHLLLPIFAPETRVINVASQAYAKGRLTQLPPSTTPYAAMRAYRDSKLALVLFTLELARRTDPSVLTANALHPGVIRTDIGSRDTSPALALGWRVLSTFAGSVASGATTPLHLALSPDLQGQTGRFWINRRAVPLRRSAHNMPLQTALWQHIAETTAWELA